MAEETSVPVSTEIPTTPTKASPKKQKKPAKQAAHPATATMVNSAIENLKERGGSSLQAIKKYISSTYKVDAEKYAPFIRKYIKASVTSGFLIQTKGKGASGSFKLATAITNKTAKVETNKSDKPRGRPKKAAAEKSPSPKKSPAKKATKAKRAAPPPASPKKTAKARAAKSPSKVKKTAKSPTKKPKSPKPKTTKKAAPKSPRKAASPKKK